MFRTLSTASRAVQIAGLLAATLSVTPAWATEVIPMDTRALLQSSQQVVVGQVKAVRSYWDANHRHILTDVTVAVSTTVKGAESPTLTLTQMGGEVDGMRYAIEGSPEFKTGDEALLFVWRDAKGRAQVNGLSQGRFTIARDAKGRRVLDRALPGPTGKPQAGTYRMSRAAEVAPVALDDAVAELRHLMATPAAQPTR